MDQRAIRHTPMSPDAHGIGEGQVVFRLRCGRGDLKNCTLHYADRACRVTPVTFSGAPMRVEARDEWFDYYQVILNSPYKRLCYYFELDDGEQRVLYYGDFFYDHLVDDRSEYYQLPFNHRADIAAVPAWAEDAVVYNIFPDSFSTSRGYISGVAAEKSWKGQTVRGKWGGTLRGITENAEYLKELGVNCIYINPIFAAGEYHKYDLLDYFHIDPCFGTNGDFRELVETYHQKGMRVIIDGVFNHVGWHFFAFEDVVEKGEASRYKDWFYGLKFPVRRPETGEEYPGYECFGYERMMPKTNTQNPQVMEYFCKVGRYWIEKFNIDGWRLDVASEVNDAFWRSFRQAVKAVKPDCLVIGEVWESAQHWLAGDMFDSTMNYDLRKHCRRFFAEQAIDAAQFDGRVTNMRMRYKQNMLCAQLNLLDSHDVSRFFSLCGQNEAKMKLAVLFQMTFVGIPSVFYGDERGICGTREEEYRRPMAWEGPPSPLYAFYKKAIGLRRQCKALRGGSFHTLSARPGQGLYCYERVLEGQKIVIALNNQPVRARLPRQISASKVLWAEGLEGAALAPMGFVAAEQEMTG